MAACFKPKKVKFLEAPSLPTHAPKEEDMHSHAAWEEVKIRRTKPAYRFQVGKAKGKTCALPLKVAREFSQETSLSGMKYITREGTTILDRLVWTVACLICLAAALFFMHSAWNDYLQSPILTTIQDTYYPLYKLSFPAITVCPSNNVRRRVGEQLLLEFLNVSSDNSNTLQNLMKALSFLRYPYYSKMEEHLNKVRDIKRFDGLNITNFMLQVLPTLSEIMNDCYWQGHRRNCSSLFDLQRYEGGFCYSFNSLTSENKRHCGLIYTNDEMSLNTSDEKYESRRCFLLHNAASGTATGLEVYLQPTESADVPRESQRRAAISEGIRVLWHAPNEYPLAGSGLFMLDKQSKVGTIKIMSSITESSSSLRSFSPTQRSCFFEDEKTLQLYPTYSQTNCYKECRLKYIQKVCKCIPYFFSQPHDTTPVCSVSQLYCIIQQSRALEFFVISESQVDSNAMNCSNCLPTCNKIRYDVDASFSEDTKPFQDTNLGYLNVYYKEQSAVKYLRAPAVDEMKLMVSFGGIAGLFLGVSLITCIEILYYLVRFCKSFCYHYCHLITGQRSVANNETSSLTGINAHDIMQHIPHGTSIKY